jgi:hypothetical protein
VGIPVLVLGAWAVLQSGLRVWKGLVIGALLLALGGLTPLYGLLRALPGFDFFRFPARFTLVASLGLIVLAASALDRLLETDAKRARRRLGWVIRGLVLLGFVAMGLLGNLIAGRRLGLVESAEQATGDPDRAVQFVDGLIASMNPLASPNLMAVLLALVLVLILSLRSRGLGAPRVGRALVILLVVDLSVFGMNYNPATTPSAASAAPSSVDLLEEAARAGQGRMAVVDRVQSPALDRELLSASLGLVWGAHEVAVLSPLALPENEALLEQAGLNVGMDHGPKKVFDALAHLHLVDMMGVRLLYSVHSLPHPQLRLLRKQGGVNIYENIQALPRAFAVGCVQAVEDSKKALEAMATPFDPRTLAFIEGAETAGCEGFESKVDITEQGAQGFAMNAELSGPGYLVLTDSWYPGWKAWVNGEEQPILRANSSFKAVALPGGSSEIQFLYAPSWAWSLWVWPVAWLSILLGLLRERWRSTRASA